MEIIRPQIGKAYVRILGKRLGRFIEFEFLLNDEDLCVELVMPEDGFREFCAYYDAELLPSRAQADEADDGTDSERVPGLYHAPATDLS